ncbi:MAG: NADP-dependent phosphogluconate dehydrogenase [Flavobacteriaceae bacterium]
MKKTYIIMGVSGSGKTTIGKDLAKKLAIPFYDADDFHSKENKAKMASGIPLVDTDRKPWLEVLQKEMHSWENGGVLACSALKESYRALLSEGNTIQWIYLDGDFDTISKRMKKRNHFMKPEMLQSQFEALEPPSYGIQVSVKDTPEDIVSRIIFKLQKMKLSEFGIIGMGVMGRSLAKNILRNGYSLSVYNRDTEAEKNIIPNLLSEVQNEQLHGFTSLSQFVESLATPRKIVLMIPAGNPVDTLLNELTPLLSNRDVIMDGGNSHYKDTQRREKYIKDKGFHYLGIGISGGEEGALRGPSMMVGGDINAYNLVKGILEAITAKDFKNNPCVSNFGSNGAGHFIKTIHNGIEYGEMQLIAEVYSLLKPTLSNDEIAELLTQWNCNETKSFLLETTLSVLQKKEDKESLLDKIWDVAASKGTGTWSSISALEEGVPATILSAAVMERAISNNKALRKSLSEKLEYESFAATIATEKLKSAYQFARILNHQQGLQLIETTSNTEGWNVDLSEVVRVWTNGCILKSQLLEIIHPLLENHSNLLEATSIQSVLKESENDVSDILVWGMQQRNALPCLSASLNYWYGITTNNSAANLIQAQRDAFGAHTYKRIDKPKDQSFTTNWKLNG